jgi:hypothetical protein
MVPYDLIIPPRFVNVWLERDSSLNPSLCTDRNDLPLNGERKSQVSLFSKFVTILLPHMYLPRIYTVDKEASLSQYIGPSDAMI